MQTEETTLKNLIDVVWNDFKPSEAHTVFHEDCILHHNGPAEFGGEDYVGLAAIKERYILPFQKAFPDLTHQVQSCFYFHGGAVMRFTGTGTNSGDYFGMGISGKSLLYHGIAQFRFRDGMLAEVWTNSNYASQFQFE